MKHRITFALIMGLITTGIISFAVVSFNLGMAYHHTDVWMRSWLIAYMVVIPVILLIAPWVEKLVRLIYGTR